VTLCVSGHQKTARRNIRVVTVPWPRNMQATKNLLIKRKRTKRKRSSVYDSDYFRMHVPLYRSKWRCKNVYL